MTFRQIRGSSAGFESPLTTGLVAELPHFVSKGIADRMPTDRISKIGLPPTA